LSDRQRHFEDIIKSLTKLEIELWQMDIKSAQERTQAIRSEKHIRSMAKLRVD